MPQPTLSPQTQDAIDRELSPHLKPVKAGATGAAILTSLGALFQLLAPILIKVLQDFAASGTAPTAANIFEAGHKMTATGPDAVRYAPDSRPSG